MSNMVFCPRCGSLMPPFAPKCKRCGYNPKGDDDEADETEINVPKSAPKVVEQENPDNPYFPYKPRDKQMDIVNDMYSAFQRGEHIVVESGTGTGKTIVSLAAALNHAIPNRKKILYLSRTITQSDQVMRELRSISKLRPVTGITITGRGRSCPFLRTLENYEKIPANVLANLCEENKKKAISGAGGCPFYRSIKEKLEDAERFCRNSLPTSSELDVYCEDNGICPYETKKALLKSVTVVTAPYIQILSEDIRKGFLGNLESDGTDLIAIVDEAHNIIDAAREQESYTISLQLVNNANDEVTTFREDPEIFDNVHLGQFITEIKMSMRSFANEKLTLTKKEEILDPKALEDRLRKKFSLDPNEMSYAIDRMIALGEERTDMLVEKGENKVSDIFTLAIALKNWILSDPGKYIKSVKADENGESLHAACIDPSDVTYFLRSIKGVVHMSGTLDPPAQYAKVLGLPNGTVLRKYPSPFPPENRSVVYVRDVTTRYDDMKKDPKIQERIQSYIVRLCTSVEKNTLVFFPSYGMMSKMRPYIEKYLDKELYWEESRQPRKTASNLIKFRKGRNGVFFTVMGGSIAEGIDFPGEELCFSIIVGIPYPPPTLEMKAMAAMFDERYGYGAGWRYASEIPALRKMLQAIGRMIRTETDRGMAVILDSRAEKYQLKLGAKATEDPIGDAVRFFMH